MSFCDDWEAAFRGDELSSAIIVSYAKTAAHGKMKE
jgi:hypothetical protein